MTSENKKAALTVNWSKIPTLNELKKHLETVKREISKTSIMFSLKGFEEISYFCHNTNQVSSVKSLYNENGFETKRVIQDPFSHSGPTVACPIGFPSNLYKRFDELRRFNRWICRLHVDIGEDKNGGIISAPHIEQDPLFHPFTHFREAFMKGNVVRGKVALELLRYFID